MGYIEDFIKFICERNQPLSKKFQSVNIRAEDTIKNFRLIFYPSSCRITLTELNQLQSLWEDFVHGYAPDAKVHPLLIDGTIWVLGEMSYTPATIL